VIKFGLNLTAKVGNYPKNPKSCRKTKQNHSFHFEEKKLSLPLRQIIGYA
jgi:hypothetical protein